MQTDGHDDERARYLAAMETVATASEHVIEALQNANQARAVVREHMAHGGLLSDLEHIVSPEPLRAAVSQALTELERARHDASRLLFRLLQAEGQSMTDIGRMWGVSRQLVSRMVNEPASDTSP
jgi:hypothetical protein